MIISSVLSQIIQIWKTILYFKNENLLFTMIENVAHIRSDSMKIQTLEDHLFGTSNLASGFMSSLGLESVGELIGLLHDLGKASKAFNEYIMGEGNHSRGEIDHSTAGASYLYRRKPSYSEENVYQLIAFEMMELAIVSHHSGLIDVITIDGENNYSRRMEKHIQYDENIQRIGRQVLERAETLLPVASSCLGNMIHKILDDGSNVKDKGNFRLGLLNRFLLSALIDSDRIDTISFETNRQYLPKNVDFKILSDRLDSYIDAFPIDDEISKIRRIVSDECLSASCRPKGIFTLSVPTGGGKTLSSLRFAINHARIYGMSRIIFVAPYLTILEQNASVVRKALGNLNDDELVECHSNIDVGKENSDHETTLDSGVDSWDAPIIFTSMVQFLETLFSSGTRRVRRMHNLANSVIIFDEIQSLPIKTTFMFNEAITFLTEYCKSSVVLCTATQPTLGGNLDYPLRLTKESEIIENPFELYKSLKRTQVHYLNKGGMPAGHGEVARVALDSINDHRSVLVIVNTKSMAKHVFEDIRSQLLEDVSVFHLSTDMCPIHRKKVLQNVLDSLGNKKIICVSTQLIEAGVDVDFEVVIRSLAGLDSIAQAAGRCNRNGLMECGDVFVLKTDENIGPLVDIAEGRRCSEPLLSREIDDPLGIGPMREYYNAYFFKRSHDMYYKTDNADSSLFQMLSGNSASVRLAISRTGTHPCVFMKQSFSEANHCFAVIERLGSVIIPYDEVAREAIARLSSGANPGDFKDIMHTLQRYSVNTFSLNKMIRDRIVYEISEDTGVYCLVEGYYSDDTGIIEKPEMTTMIL